MSRGQLQDGLKKAATTGDVEKLDDNFDTSKWTDLHWAAYKGHNGEVISILLGEENNHAKDSNVVTPLHIAAYKNDTQIALTLINDRESVNLQDELGNTALHIASSKGHKDIAQTLVQFGKANVNIKNKNKETPLHIACSHGFHQIANLLVNAGADIDAKDINNCTPLDLATSREDSKTIDLLEKQEKGLSKLAEGIGHSQIKLSFLQNYLLEYSKSNGLSLVKKVNGDEHYKVNNEEIKQLSSNPNFKQGFQQFRKNCTSTHTTNQINVASTSPKR